MAIGVGMFTRITGFLIVPLWLVAMGWVFAHDVWPRWTAMEAPPLSVNDWLSDEGRESQYAIFQDHVQVGIFWTTYRIDSQSVQREDLLLIEKFSLDITPLRVVSLSVFTSAGKLDEFTVRMENPSLHGELHGERFSEDFSFTFKVGPTPRLSRRYKVPLTDGDLISGATNPFAHLSDLKVGQRWRMQVFNPLSAILGIGSQFTSMLVEVTGQESIVVDGTLRNCFVIESANAKAWVDENGAVQVQEALLPLVGTLRMVRQAECDVDARRRAQKQYFYRGVLDDRQDD